MTFCKKEYACGCEQVNDYCKQDKHNCSCGDYEFENPCLHCNKYTEASNKKCHQASVVNQEANEVAACAVKLEKQAEELQEQANKLACEAQKYWERYSKLSGQSAALMREAQMALEKGIECQKKCVSHGLGEDCRPCCSDCKPCCKKYNGC